MKGTAPRGATPAADAAQAEFLRSAPKERAENLMIVDLLRNDLSRLAEPHSVRVPRLFHTEAWPTVWQMSSDVVATTRPGTTLGDVFAALFPCGSITGAPKVQAMRLIRALEPEPRGVYCGAIGVVQPGGAATFNVPIRTLALRRAGATTTVRCGIGSGITADASAAGEWDEWRHKRAFVDRASQTFELLETLRLQDGVFVDAEAHLERLAGAAWHFAFASPLAAARDALERLRAAHPGGHWRVRLLADRAGAARAQAFALAPPLAPVHVRLADRPLAGSDGEFVRFKTTRRAHYDAFAPTEDDVFDTLLWNERGELTEFTRGNLALRIDGRWLTPAATCGLLPGIARARLLREGTLAEATLTRADLARAEGLAFFNSLRGWLPAALDPPPR
jgi:para-aminobenzoate synthetase / 4-amino-4-deoxychorismate lyase